METNYVDRVMELRDRPQSAQSAFISQRDDERKRYHLFEVRPHENPKFSVNRIFYHNSVFTDILLIPYERPENSYKTVDMYINREVENGYHVIPKFIERVSIDGNNVYLYNAYGANQTPFHVQQIGASFKEIETALIGGSGFRFVGTDALSRSSYRNFDSSLKGVWVSHTTPRFASSELLTSNAYTSTTFLTIGGTLFDLKRKTETEFVRSAVNASPRNTFYYEADHLYRVGYHQTDWERID